VLSVRAVHDAARRYCLENAQRWRDRYADLLARQEAQSGDFDPLAGGDYTYSKEALATFPRYNVLDAILDAIEDFVPEDFGSAAEARESLIMVARHAQSMFTEPPNDPVSERAMREEREAFIDFLSRLSPAEVDSADRLPFRRRLSPEEFRDMTLHLRARWGVTSNYWYPLDRADDVDAPPDTFAFASEPFFDDELQARLRGVLERHGVKRVFEMREYGSSYEVDLDWFFPIYNGAEGYWTDRSFDWLVYASHESSVTIAGRHLLAEVRREWPDWREHPWNPLVA
jgi:hypothetical protein